MISVILSLFCFGFLGAELNGGITFGQEAWVLGGGDSEFVVEAVMPDLGHVLPVVDDTVLNGVGELEDTLLGLGLFADIGFFAIEANHDVVVFWSTHDGGE
jgi:hypothetical protein